MTYHLRDKHTVQNTGWGQGWRTKAEDQWRTDIRATHEMPRIPQSYKGRFPAWRNACIARNATYMNSTQQGNADAGVKKQALCPYKYYQSKLVQIISDQPKGLYGLMSRAKYKGKGKDKGKSSILTLDDE